jgi:hypothetical protein
MAAPALATTPGITVNPISGLTTTEIGGTATFEIWLSEAPTVDVTIGLSSSDTGEGTVAPASVSFNSTNFLDHQTVTITGVNDAVDDGNIAYTIVTAPAVSGDSNYNEKNAADVSVTNTDDDTAGVTVGTISRHTSEALLTANFTLVLNSQPTAAVTIPLESDDPSEGTITVASVIFTTVNWNVAQYVTVTGVNDFVADGDITYYIITGNATSTDPKYGAPASINPANVTVVNDDNDTVGVTVSLISDNTTEAGGTATFTIVLDIPTTANVTIPLESDDLLEGTIAVANVVFTADNWDEPQYVTVTGVNDNVDDGPQGYNIVTAAAAGGNYAGLLVADVAVTNTSDDPKGVTVTPTAGLVTTEGGGTATFTIVLNSEPTAAVTIGLSSSNLLEGTVAPASVTFTTANWDDEQIVTVTGVDDDVVDGNIGYTIVTAAATGGDYAGIDPANVTVTNNDDDQSGNTILDAVNNIRTLLENTTYGLAEIKREVAIIEAAVVTEIADIKAKTDNINWVDITNIDTVVDAIKAKTDNINWLDITNIDTVVDAIKAKTDNINWDNITTIDTVVDAIKAKTDTIVWANITSIGTALDNADHGLAAIKDAIDNIDVGAGSVASVKAIDVSIARNAGGIIVVAGTQAFWGQLTVQSTRAGYNIEVWDGDSWLPVKPSGLVADSISVSGLGLRIYNDTTAAIVVDYVFVYHQAP